MHFKFIVTERTFAQHPIRCGQISKSEWQLCVYLCAMHTHHHKKKTQVQLARARFHRLTCMVNYLRSFVASRITEWEMKVVTGDHLKAIKWIEREIFFLLDRSQLNDIKAHKTKKIEFTHAIMPSSYTFYILWVVDLIEKIVITKSS